MSKHTLFLFFINSLFALVLFSCGSEGMITEGTTLSDDITPVLNFPERVPADAHLNTLMLSGQKDWVAYDKYYRNEVLNQRDEVFFNNLQWSTIAFMVKNTDFLENAESSTQSYYLNEILNREYINKPDVVIALMQKLQADGTEGHKLPSIARDVLAINNDYLTEQNFNNHKERNKEAYNELFNFGYDRWGQEK